MASNANVPAAKHAISRNIVTFLSGAAGAQLIGVLALPFLSRVYAPTEFGVFAVFLSVSGTISVVAALRYEYAIVLPKDDGDALGVRRLATVIVCIVALLTLLTSLAFFAWSAPDARRWWVLLIGVSVLFAGVTSTSFYWFTRKHNYRVQSASRIVQALTTAGSQIVLGLMLTPATEWLIVGYLLGQLAGAIILLLARPNAEPKEAPRRLIDLVKRYRKMPLFNAPNALVDSLRLNGMNIIIARHSIDSLGQFSMAWKVASAPVGLLASAITQVYYPHMAAAAPGELGPLVRRVTTRALGVGFLPMLSLAVTAPLIVPWLLGDGWGQTGLIVQALSPYLYLTVATAPLATVFIVVERQGTMLMFAVVYTIAPLSVLAVAGSAIIPAMWLLSATMSLLLLFLIFLAHRAASHFDRPRDRQHDET